MIKKKIWHAWHCKKIVLALYSDYVSEIRSDQGRLIIFNVFHCYLYIVLSNSIILLYIYIYIYTLVSLNFVVLQWL